MKSLIEKASFQKNRWGYILGFLSLLTLIGAVFFYYAKKTQWSLNASDITYKLPVSDKSSILDEINRLKTQMNTTDKTTLSQTLAQLANLYVSLAKKTGQLEFYNESEHLAERSLKLAPKNKAATLAMAKVLAARHDFSKALDLLNELPELNKDNEDTGYLRAVNYIALGRFAEAFSAANSVIKTSPNISTATLKALIYSYLGQDDMAFYYFQTSLQLEDIGEETQSVLSRGQFATFLIKKGNYSDAIKLCDSALKIIPNNAYNKLVKAQALNAQKKYAAAYALLTEAFAESKEPIYLLNMVYSLKLLKKHSDFKILAEQALQIYKTEIEQNKYGHLLDLASLYYVTEDYENTINTVLKDQQNRHSLRGDLLLTKALIMQKKLSQAEDVLERQIAMGSTDVTLFLLMQSLLNGESNKFLNKIYKRKIEQNNPNYNLDLLYQLP